MELLPEKTSVQWSQVGSRVWTFELPEFGANMYIHTVHKPDMLEQSQNFTSQNVNK